MVQSIEGVLIFALRCDCPQCQYENIVPIDLKQLRAFTKCYHCKGSIDIDLINYIPNKTDIETTQRYLVRH